MPIPIHANGRFEAIFLNVTQPKLDIRNDSLVVVLRQPTLGSYRGDYAEANFLTLHDELHHELGANSRVGGRKPCAFALPIARREVPRLLPEWRKACIRRQLKKNGKEISNS